MGFAAAAASAVIGGGADILGGAAQKSAADAEGKQYEQNARNAMTASDQMQGERLRDLRSTFSSIDAIRAGSGLDLSSPTGQAIRDRLSTDAGRSITTDRANALGQASSNYNASASIRAQGKAAYIGGFLKAGAGLIKASAHRPGGGT